MNISYRELLDKLKTLTDEQLNQTVTLYNANNDELFPANSFAITGEEEEDEVRPETDVVGPHHPYIMFEL